MGVKTVLKKGGRVAVAAIAHPTAFAGDIISGVSMGTQKVGNGILKKVQRVALQPGRALRRQGMLNPSRIGDLILTSTGITLGIAGGVVWAFALAGRGILKVGDFALRLINRYTLRGIGKELSCRLKGTSYFGGEKERANFQEAYEAYREAEDDDRSFVQFLRDHIAERNSELGV